MDKIRKVQEEISNTKSKKRKADLYRYLKKLLKKEAVENIKKMRKNY